MAAVFAAGVLFVCGLGVGTDLFDSGPTDVEVNAAYLEGLQVGEAAADAAWEERLNDVWWENYDRGYAEQNSMAPSIQRAVIDGFSWEGGYAAGFESVEAAEFDDGESYWPSYWRGWITGYEHGRALAEGSPQPIESGNTLTVEWGGET